MPDSFTGNHDYADNPPRGRVGRPATRPPRRGRGQPPARLVAHRRSRSVRDGRAHAHEPVGLGRRSRRRADAGMPTPMPVPMPMPFAGGGAGISGPNVSSAAARRWTRRCSPCSARRCATRAAASDASPRAWWRARSPPGQRASSARWPRTPTPASARVGLLGLGELEDPGTIGTITNALGDRDANVRAMAAWALGQLEDPQAIAPLGKALGDESPLVRRRAAWALGEIEDEAALAPSRACAPRPRRRRSAHRGVGDGRD